MLWCFLYQNDGHVCENSQKQILHVCVSLEERKRNYHLLVNSFRLILNFFPEVGNLGGGLTTYETDGVYIGV